MWIYQNKVYKTHSDIRRIFTNVSLPAVITDEVLAEFDVLPITQTAPVFDPLTQVAEDAAPIQIAGVWTQQWAVRSMTGPEQAAVAAKAAQDALDLADANAKADAKADATIQYLVRHTPAEIATKLNTDITNLATAKEVIIRLAVAVSALARKELR